MLAGTIRERAQQIEKSAAKTRDNVSKIIWGLEGGFVFMLFVPLLIWQVIPSFVPNLPAKPELVCATYNGNSEVVVNLGGVQVFFMVFMFAVVCLILSLYFTTLLNKPQYGTLRVNDNASIGTVSTEARVKYQRLLLFLPLGVFFFIVGYYSYATATSVAVGMKYASYNLICIGFLAAWLVCILLGYRVVRMKTNITAPVNEANSPGGVGILPKRIRAGESHNVAVDFEVLPNDDPKNPRAEANLSANEKYEAEIEAVGATIKTNAKIVIGKDSLIPASIWNCSFEKPGNQTINLILRKGGSHHHASKTVFMYPHTVIVESAFTASLQPVIALVISSLSVITTMMGIIGLK